MLATTRDSGGCCNDEGGAAAAALGHLRDRNAHFSSLDLVCRSLQQAKREAKLVAKEIRGGTPKRAAPATTVRTAVAPAPRSTLRDSWLTYDGSILTEHRTVNFPSFDCVEYPEAVFRGASTQDTDASEEAKAEEAYETGNIVSAISEPQTCTGDDEPVADARSSSDSSDQVIHQHEIGSPSNPGAAGRSRRWRAVLARGSPYYVSKEQRKQEEDQRNAEAKAALVAKKFRMKAMAAKARTIVENHIESKRLESETKELQEKESCAAATAPMEGEHMNRKKMSAVVRARRRAALLHRKQRVEEQKKKEEREKIVRAKKALEEFGRSQQKLPIATQKARPSTQGGATAPLHPKVVAGASPWAKGSVAQPRTPLPFPQQSRPVSTGASRMSECKVRYKRRAEKERREKELQDSLTAQKERYAAAAASMERRMQEQRQRARAQRAEELRKKDLVMAFLRESEALAEAGRAAARRRLAERCKLQRESSSEEVLPGPSDDGSKGADVHPRRKSRRRKKHPKGPRVTRHSLM